MIKVLNINQTLQDLKIKLSTEIDKQKSSKTNKLLKDLKANTPVDTGTARDSWVIENGNIVNTTDYIDDLNRGTSVQAPEYFIEKTLLANEGVSPNGTIVTVR